MLNSSGLVATNLLLKAECLRYQLDSLLLDLTSASCMSIAIQIINCIERNKICAYTPTNNYNTTSFTDKAIQTQLYTITKQKELH